MKKLLLLLLCFCTAQAFGQIYIKYDLNTRTADKPIPFDKPFTLEVSPVKSKTISKIMVYWMDYENGLKVINDPNYKASFELKKDARSDDNKVILTFPALKPERNFRVQLLLAYSSKSNLKLYSLLKNIFKAEQNGVTISTDSNLDTQLAELVSYAEIHIPGDKDSMSPFQFTLPNFVTQVYTPASTELKMLLDTSDTVKPYKKLPNFIDQAALTSIAGQLDPKAFMATNTHFAQRFIDNGTINKIMMGLLPYNYKHPDSVTLSYNFEARSKNLAANKAYIDSLRTAATLLKAKAPGTFTGILSTIETAYLDLEFNERTFNSNVAKMRSVFPKTLAEISNLLDASTLSADLQTVSKRRLTVEAGFANLWLKDNFNKQKQMLKPFLGVTYHFRSYDKTADLRTLPPPDMKDGYAHTLESRYNFWQRFSLTFGLTLGSMTNKDFDNAYSSFSFICGPSFRLVNGIRVSAGASAAKRFGNNPLVTEKKLVYGTYASISLDYDLLTAVESVAKMIFK